VIRQALETLERIEGNQRVTIANNTRAAEKNEAALVEIKSRLDQLPLKLAGVVSSAARAAGK